MYRELYPLRQALSAELKANLPPAGPGIKVEHLLQTYLPKFGPNKWLSAHKDVRV